MIPQNAMADTDPILFYDGTCGLCARTVQFVLRHERRRHDLRFAPLQGPSAATLKRRVPSLAGIDSVIWYQPPTGGEPERIRVRSAVGLTILRYLGGPWRLLLVTWVIPGPLRDALYNLIARYRHQVAGAACLLPTPEQRARFMD
jgi:predicted DCC family thiol-disulfide oxidoreductase YuxK